jgi:CelD/BcsL family acetyltransferase involved in cellulose biosynthesis
LRSNRWSLALLPGNHVPPELSSWLFKKAVLVGKPADSHFRALPPSWDALAASLNKSMRDNVKYYPRLIDRRGHVAKFRICATPQQVSEALSVFFDLHRARATAAASVAHEDRFRFTDRRHFLRKVAALLAARGAFKVGLLEVDGAVVAAQLWLEEANALFVYYSGYDPVWAPYSVQLVATIECLKDAIGRGLERVEFLRGGGHAKERWGTERRVRVNVTLSRWTGPARIVLGLPRVRRRLRLRGTTTNPGAVLRQPAG